jgi:hypothetical protein
MQRLQLMCLTVFAVGCTAIRHSFSPSVRRLQLAAPMRTRANRHGPAGKMPQFERDHVALRLIRVRKSNMAAAKEQTVFATLRADYVASTLSPRPGFPEPLPPAAWRRRLWRRAASACNQRRYP